MNRCSISIYHSVTIQHHYLHLLNNFATVFGIFCIAVFNLVIFLTVLKVIQIPVTNKMRKAIIAVLVVTLLFVAAITAESPPEVLCFNTIDSLITYHLTI
jgi:hypothetical protein